MSERDELAARYFPERWERVANAVGKSKARQKLRREAEHHQTVDRLRANGSCCENCRAYNTRQIFGMSMKAHCDRLSDFHGYAEVKPDFLCPDWTAKP